MGVDYRDFWELSPKSLYIISEAFNDKLDMEYSKLWLQGLYMQYAFGSVQSSKVKYPNQPFHKKHSDSKTFDEMTDEEITNRLNNIASVFNSML